ncbi:MAG: class I SAM-dependent methyltransferase [Pirellulales bacterium]
MNKLLLCAYHLRKLRPTERKRVTAHVVTDHPHDFNDQDCRRMFSAWYSWLEIGTCATISLPCDASALSSLGVAKGDFVISLCERFWELWPACNELGAHCIGPEFPPLGTFDNDLVREVSFFDHEFGGKNEWDGSPTRYSINCLQQLSSANCRDYFPAWAFELVPLTVPRPLKVMDIGCGPVSMLRWGAIQGDIAITGLDPLIEMYTLVLARHGLDRLERIRCHQEVNGVAEDMDLLLPDQLFDVIYTQNALDHTQQPSVVVENVSRHLAPLGLFAVQVATREGTRQNWDQLHKTDIYVANGQIMFAHQDGIEHPLLPETLRLKKIFEDTPDWLAFVAEKAA